MMRQLLPVAALLLTACNSSKDPAEQVQITYTAYGVPHIEASSYRGLGYGVGYSQASENLCTLSEQILKLQGKQARTFGPGPNQYFVLMDAGYLGLNLPAMAAERLAALPEDARAALNGYVAGFNQRLSEFDSPAAYPSPCRDADWVQPISETDLLAYHMDLALLASSRNFLTAMAAAQPPSGEAGIELALNPTQLFSANGLGSNGWALGAERSAGAKASLLANPHFPWDGELRFFEQHLTIPGTLDVTGASMIGMPAVLIGFNQQLGWTHTVSQGKRFTLYQLELEPGNPMRYRYDDEYLDITPQQVTVEIRQADGSLISHEHTLYHSHFGPLVNLASLDPSLGWTSQSAVAIKDANLGNSRMLQQWLALNKASTTAEFFDALAEHQGIPWVNTLLASSEGTASYVDASQVPRLHPEAEQIMRQAITAPPLSVLWQDGAGSLLLPGNNPLFAWYDSGQTHTPGLVPLPEAPKLTRDDYAFNANSSHWLSHLTELLEGYSLVYGPEQSIRSPRTRYNAMLLTSHIVSGSDGQFDLAALQQVLDHNGSLFGQTLHQPLLQRCQDAPLLQLDEAVDLTPACQALAQWDGKYQLSSQGALLMREFLAEFRVPGHRDLSDTLFALPFDPALPAETPTGLAAAGEPAEQDPILLALAAAQQRLQQAGINPQAPLADVQQLVKASGQQPIPMHGGYSYEGVFNMVEGVAQSRSTSRLATIITGQPRPDRSPLMLLEDSSYGYRSNYGSSYVLALQFSEQGPQAKMLLAYSQSHDPESVHFDDQTQAFSQLQWRPVLFKAEDIAANQVKQLVLTLPQQDTQ